MNDAMTRAMYLLSAHNRPEKSMHIKIQNEELRRRVLENLDGHRSGRVARELDREKARRSEQRQQRQQIKLAKRKLKSTRKKLDRVEAERQGLQEYMEELMVGTEPRPGFLDEVDHAIEGCTEEIEDLYKEMAALEKIIEG
jgi:cell division septum initiation protein DivIVA